jgi:hypothetical protein
VSAITPSSAPFFSALAAPGRAPEISATDDLYGWLVGDWQLDVLHYWAQNVAAQNIKAEVHAAWVLEGRAVQDIWIMPRRQERAGQLDNQMNMYGTTLRVWDRALGAWRITWSNPAGDHYEEQIGRKNGDDIVQIGTRPDGTTTRWTFNEITADSFHWLGEAQAAGSAAWKIEGEFRAARKR